MIDAHLLLHAALFVAAIGTAVLLGIILTILALVVPGIRL